MYFSLWVRKILTSVVCQELCICYLLKFPHKPNKLILPASLQRVVVNTQES